MRIEVLMPFTDLQADDPAAADRSTGDKLTVAAERGAELVGLGLAAEIDPPVKKAASKPSQDKPTPAKRASPRKTRSKATASAPVAPPATPTPAPSPDPVATDTAPAA